MKMHPLVRRVSGTPYTQVHKLQYLQMAEIRRFFLSNIGNRTKVSKIITNKCTVFCVSMHSIFLFKIKSLLKIVENGVSKVLALL